MLKRTRHLRKPGAGLALIALVGLLALPGLAAAQSPSDDQYDSATERIETLAGGGGGSAGTGDGSPSGLESTVGPLPFTGFDVVAMLAVALAVTGLGLGLQRAVSRQPHES